jgi:hypothetical protein
LAFESFVVADAKRSLLPGLGKRGFVLALVRLCCDCDTRGEDALGRKLRRIDESRTKKSNTDRAGR